MYKVVKKGTREEMKEQEVRKDDILEYTVKGLAGEKEVVQKAGDLVYGLEQRGVKAINTASIREDENTGTWTIQLKIIGETKNQFQQQAISPAALTTIKFVTLIFVTYFMYKTIEQITLKRKYEMLENEGRSGGDIFLKDLSDVLDWKTVAGATAIIYLTTKE